jgi:hypothetical protein
MTQQLSTRSRPRRQRPQEGPARRLVPGAIAALAAGLLLVAIDARAAPTTATLPDHTVALQSAHDNPRLKLSFRQLSIANLDGSKVPLAGAELDVYPLSRRWVRLGIELEGGAGDVSLASYGASLWYTLCGLSLGVQYPARITPFVEGRGAVGALGGHLAQTVALSSSLSLAQASTVTYLIVGGIDVGVELYVVRRLYLSLAVGWAHPTYRGADYATLLKSGSLVQKSISADTFTFKVGFGI